MKKKSLSLILRIRYWSSVIYYLCMLYYGTMLISLYGIEDIGVIYSILILFSFLIALLCIMIKSETLLRYADPININNRKRYSIIFFIECTELIIAYILADISNKNYSYVIVYCIYVTSIFFISRNIHLKIINNYNDIKCNSRFNDILEWYLCAIKSDIDIDTDLLFNNFIKFMFYIISLCFIYKFTLYNWIFTSIFIMLNIYVLWKLHWIGIKKLVKYKYFYFSMVCLISTGGIVLLKLIYDKIIYLYIFRDRDVQEYLMVLVLFFLPLIYYGSKISIRYINKVNKWVE